MPKIIELNMKVDTSLIEDAIHKTWAQELAQPRFSSSHSEHTGWAEVQKQVRDYISRMDITDLIIRIANEKLHSTIDEAVSSILRERAKKLAKDMLKDGTLL